MPITVREASPTDAGVIVRLIAGLAAYEDWPLELTAEYVPVYLGFPGSHALLAGQDGEPVGLLAYSLRPGLFHGGESGYVEELVVLPAARRRGVARQLLRRAMRQMGERGCKEISLSVGLQNTEAQRLYRSLGLTEESLLLERHLRPPD